MEATRPHLPPRAAALLDAFESPHVLGASRQLDIATDLLATLAAEHEGSSADLVRQLRQVAAYLVARRGDSSQAFPNALALMLDGIEERQRGTVAALRKAVIEQAGDFAKRSRCQLAAIAEYGATLASGAERILAFDFSSSVAAILKAIDRTPTLPTVLIPEARTLDGGRRYVEDLRESRLPIEFIPDAAVGSKVSGCDLAFIGAETITAEGGCFNTTGSLLVALACQHWRVPLYTATTSLKIDTRTLFGYRRQIPELDSARLGRMTEGWPRSLAARIDLACPDLDYVPPSLMAGFITEVGILPPDAIVTHAAHLADSLGND